MQTYMETKLFKFKNWCLKKNLFYVLKLSFPLKLSGYFERIKPEFQTKNFITYIKTDARSY